MFCIIHKSSVVDEVSILILLSLCSRFNTCNVETSCRILVVRLDLVLFHHCESILFIMLVEKFIVYPRKLFFHSQLISTVPHSKSLVHFSLTLWHLLPRTVPASIHQHPFPSWLHIPHSSRTINTNYRYMKPVATWEDHTPSHQTVNIS